jgi:hypothetical protein
VGDEAVFKVLRWTGGSFELDFEGKTNKETTQLNTQGLLMEGLRLLDESARDGGGEGGGEGAVPSGGAASGDVSSGGPAVGAAVSSPAAATDAGSGGREEEEDVLLDS